MLLLLSGNKIQEDVAFIEKKKVDATKMEQKKSKDELLQKANKFSKIEI